MYSVDYVKVALEERKRMLENPQYKLKINYSDKELQKNAKNLYSHYMNTITKPLKDKEKIESTFKLNDVQKRKLQYLFDSAYSDEYILLWLAKELSNNIYLDSSISKNMKDIFLRQWFRKLNVIGQGAEGITLLTKHSGLDVDFVMKTSQKAGSEYKNISELQKLKDDGRKSMIHEFIVGMYGLNKLRTEYHIPNFAYIFGVFDCGVGNGKNIGKSNISQSMCVAMKTADNKRIIPNRFVIYENIKSAESLANVIGNKESIKNIFNYYLQCVLACYSAYKISDFTHYDLHTDNVMIRPLPTKYSKTKTLPTIHFPYPDLFLEVENVATIIDYGFSHVSVNVDSFDEFDHSVKDSVSVPYNKNDKALLGMDKMIVDKRIPIGVSTELAFTYGISGRKSNPAYDFFKLLMSILSILFQQNRVREASEVFEPLFRAFNSKDPFTTETIFSYSEYFGGLIEQEGQQLNINIQEYVNKCIDIANSKFPGMIHKKYNESYSFDCTSPKNLCLKKYDSKYTKKNPIQTVDLYNNSLISIYYNETKTKTEYDQEIIKLAIKDYIDEIQTNIDILSKTYSIVRQLYEELISTISNNIDITKNKKRKRISGQMTLDNYNILSEFIVHINNFDFRNSENILIKSQMYFENVNSYINQFRAIEADVEFLEKAYTEMFPRAPSKFIEEIDNVLNTHYKEFLKIYIRRKTSIDFMEKMISIDSSISKSEVEVKSTRRMQKSKFVNSYTSLRNSNNMELDEVSYFTKFIKSNIVYAESWTIFINLCKSLVAEYSIIIP
jgi:hypothetical protein